MDNDRTYERYQRQMILKGFGPAAQDKLSAAKVLVIGAGGLGCPALQYLAAAGVGVIGIVDHDKVSMTNLHRQVLYSTEDVGRSKVEVAREKLLAMNTDIEIRIWDRYFGNELSVELISEFDIVVDGTDNFSTRYLINDACVLLGRPLVFGAVSQFEGQVAVFNVEEDNGDRSSNYRDIFPVPPRAGEVLNCAEAGVLGVLPGIIGATQAAEVIKLITGLGTVLKNRILTYNALTQDSYLVEFGNADQGSSAPANIEEFLKTDYEVLCGNKLPNDPGISFRDVLNRDDLLKVDVRELTEEPRITEFSCLSIPLKELEWSLDELEGKKVVFICQSGKRAMQAVQVLKSYAPAAEVYYLSGGVNGFRSNG